jgi:hypothetical protein
MTVLVYVDIMRLTRFPLLPGGRDLSSCFKSFKYFKLTMIAERETKRIIAKSRVEEKYSDWEISNIIVLVIGF